ncbi:MAG: ABC transporter substrate-binding protein [Chloroflexota bacterium]
MSALKLSLACWDYDRTRALMDGSVRPEGIELTYLPLPVEETFFRMAHYQEFDAAEMSLSGYVLSLFSQPPPFIAIPVFPSRMFRHSSIYVRAGSDIQEPAHLVGKRIGIPEYHITAAVWIRGMLADDYDVPVSSVSYFTGGQEQPGRSERVALSLPEDIRVTPIGPDQTLTEMLRQGELDALYTARAPSSFLAGAPHIRRLFPDSQSIERDYFQRTGVFPIMHAVAIKCDIYQRHPWVAQSLFKAFNTAKEQAYGQLNETTALKYTLPWLAPAVHETVALMGTDFWPYGLEANRKVLERFLRYSHTQGLAPSLLDPADLFARETQASYRI